LLGRLRQDRRRAVVARARMRHQFVDHQLGLARNPVDDVVDADRPRNVVDEEQQPADADQRQQHRAEDRQLLATAKGLNNA
jgi:hypothetical protein